MNPFTINPAVESDVPILLAMIRELAEFERLTHELEVSATSLRAALFGERSVAGALIARAEGDHAGYAIYYHSFSSFAGRVGTFLEDLYVRPKFRKSGIGRALLEAVARISIERGGGRFEWTALRWNENALQFYQKIGAKVLDEWALLRMDGPQVLKLVPAKIKGPND
jgi:GNAT superfamily N-acetyltransferase